MAAGDRAPFSMSRMLGFLLPVQGQGDRAEPRLIAPAASALCQSTTAEHRIHDDHLN